MPYYGDEMNALWHEPNRPLRGDDLAYATLDYIREHPEEWNQMQFVCGTTACFAGTAVKLGLGLQDHNQVYDYLYLAGGLGAQATAARLLGWTEQQLASVFFCFTDDFAKLEQTVKDILNQPH